MEKVRLKKQLDVTELQGEKVMIDFDTGKYYLLRGTANDIWEFLQEETTVDAIITGLMARYEVSREECAGAVLGFLAKLRELDFIE